MRKGKDGDGGRREWIGGKGGKEGAETGGREGKGANV